MRLKPYENLDRRNMKTALKMVPTPEVTKTVEYYEQDVAVFAGETYEEHVEAFSDAQLQVDSGLWDQAEIAASLVKIHGEGTVKRFAHDVKRSGSWIWDLIRTFRAFPDKSSRLYYLSFSHHVEAAKAGGKGAVIEDPAEALNAAHDEEMSTRELAHYVETGEKPDRQKTSKKTLTPELQKIHDTACRAHLDASILAIRKQAEAPPDPLLNSAYRKCIEILEWQRDRSLESDCMTIMRVFAGEEGSESPERATVDYIAAWLNGHGFIMGDAELDDRLSLLTRIRLLHGMSREGSRGPTQRGSITSVYSADNGYFEEWDRISSNPRCPERLAAVHKDWIERLKRYAPELIKAEAA